MTTGTESIFNSGFDFGFASDLDSGCDSGFVPGEQEATKMQIENIENKDAKNG
jgi:hypothetical protein